MSEGDNLIAVNCLDYQLVLKLARSGSHMGSGCLQDACLLSVEVFILRTVKYLPTADVQ